MGYYYQSVMLFEKTEFSLNPLGWHKANFDVVPELVLPNGNTHDYVQNSR